MDIKKLRAAREALLDSRPLEDPNPLIPLVEYLKLEQKYDQLNLKYSDDMGELQIKLLKGMTPLREQETLVHEIGHAIFFMYGKKNLEDEEGILDALANGYAQLGVGNFLIKQAKRRGAPKKR